MSKKGQPILSSNVSQKDMDEINLSLAKQRLSNPPDWYDSFWRAFDEDTVRNSGSWNKEDCKE